MTPDAQTRAAMVEAACVAYVKAHPILQDWPGSITQIGQENLRSWMASAITVAILAAEARGFKLVHRGATDTMKMEWVRKFDNAMGPQRMWEIQHNAAPGWGDG